MTPNRRRVLGMVAGATATLVGQGCGAAQAGTKAPGQDTRGRSRSRRFEPLGRVPIEGARDVAVDGTSAFVATLDGFAVVDIEEGSDPSVLARVEAVETDTEATLGNVWDVKTAGERLVVCGPANRTGGPTGVAVFDVSEPANPRQRSFHATESYVHNCALSDERVYVVGRDEAMSLVILDADDGRELGRWSLFDVSEDWAEVQPPLRLLHDVFVQDGRAYLPLWDAGTWIVDVADPARPRTLGRVGPFSRRQLAGIEASEASTVSLTPAGSDHYAQVNDDGTVLAVGRETWAVRDDGTAGQEGALVGGASGVTLYDIADPADPKQLARIAPPESFDQTRRGWFTTAHDFELTGDRLYSSWYFGGVAIHDVSDPASPVELARWRRPTEAAFWRARTTDGGVVATSVNVGRALGTPGSTGTAGALYVFPDRPGDQPDPPSLTDPPASGPPPGPSTEPDRLGASAGRVSGVESPTPPGDGDGPGSTDEDGSGSGLGVLAGLGGLGGLLAWRRANGLSDSPGE